ncbi:MAG TPA: siphovirus Gp157 family protein [Verrucomicrobiae bacterium]|nr:siphovirus Gp157 family protein [Verrucomicrobiae bacterium]
MTTKAAQKEALAPMPLAVDLSLESLTALFTEFVTGINRQDELEKDEEKAAAKDQNVRDAGSLLAVGEKNELAVRRDNLVELLNAIEERELRIRKTVKNAELIARHYAAFNKNLNDSLLLAMIELGIQEAQGNVHRFALHKQPDLLIITDERQIPEKFFDRTPDLELISTKIAELQSLNETAHAQVLECLEANIPTTIVLNKDRVAVAIAAGKEVPGAMIEQNRKRLDVK